MKRIIILIDGTWNNENAGADTNVAQLDPGNVNMQSRLIKATDSNGVEQLVIYHDGVGVDGSWFDKDAGGLLGLGLKSIIQTCYTKLTASYAAGDEIYILGFSRGAYAARALAALIGASGILKDATPAKVEMAWQNYRVPPGVRKQPEAANSSDKAKLADYRTLLTANHVHESRNITCVGVWDTVGSYGIPAGFGMSALARYITLMDLGFHDTYFGDHIDVGLHAVAVDEHRRPFVPTFWTIKKGQKPRGHVEQTWFAGAHTNVGGSYKDAGLSNQALIWMIARIQALTDLEFDIQAVKAQIKMNVDGDVLDSTAGIYLLDHYFPHFRVVPADSICHGYLFNTTDPQDEHINECIHWSVIKKYGREYTVSGIESGEYKPQNLPAVVPPERVAGIEPEEAAMNGAGEFSSR